MKTKAAIAWKAGEPLTIADVERNVVDDRFRAVALAHAREPRVHGLVRSLSFL